MLCTPVLKKQVCKFTIYGKDDLNQQIVIVPSSICVEKEKDEAQEWYSLSL